MSVKDEGKGRKMAHLTITSIISGSVHFGGVPALCLCGVLIGVSKRNQIRSVGKGTHPLDGIKVCVMESEVEMALWHRNRANEPVERLREREGHR